MEDYREVQIRVWNKVKQLREEGKLPKWDEEDFENEPSALANSQYRLSRDLGGFLGPQQLHELVGKTFMYISKYGLHDWTDKVSEVSMQRSMRSQPGQLLSVMSYQVDFYVRATRTDHIYPLKDVIFLD